MSLVKDEEQLSYITHVFDENVKPRPTVPYYSCLWLECQRPAVLYYSYLWQGCKTKTSCLILLMSLVCLLNQDQLSYITHVFGEDVKPRPTVLYYSCLWLGC